ncbi:MAG: transcriptional repressor [Bacteroidota bacterium]
MGVIRKTKAVKALLQLFENTDNAMSVVDLVKRLEKDINKTTVYRILERLEQDGVLHSFNGKDRLKWYAKYEGCTPEHRIDAHPHFQCKDCGSVRCLHTNISIPVVENYIVHSAEILLIGQCKDCSS